MPQWTLDALERVLLRIWTIFTASWVPTRLKWVRSAHLHRRKWERHYQIIFFPHNYLNNASQTATTSRSGGWLVKLSRIFPFVLREFYYRISTKESPVLNVERNVLVSVCTCGGKWRIINLFIFWVHLTHTLSRAVSEQNARTNWELLKSKF